MATSSVASDSVSQPSNSQRMLKRKSNDVGWEYGILADVKNPDKVQCIKCGKTMSGGIYRIKQHIAHITGNVVACPKASKEDQAICRNAIKEAKLKNIMKKEKGELLRSQVNIHKGEDFDIDQIGSVISPCTLRSMDKLTSVVNPDAYLGSERSKLEQNFDALSKQRLENVKACISRWVYEAGISFNSIELDSFKMMMEAIGLFGPGFIPPTRYEMTEPLLRREIDRTKALLKTHEEEWKLNGCSIAMDGWSDRKRRSITTLCVSSRLGTTFLSLKDFSNISYTSEVRYHYVEQCIQQVGLENVVQIVTNNTSDNVAVAKLLKEKRPKIFWTSCATHTINLMLESIAKQPRFKKVLDQAKALTIFLYAHHNVLELMRSHTKKRDVVRPGVTRFASTFLTLQSLNEKKYQLKTMFGSREWEECKFYKTVKGKAAYKTVMSMSFWSGVTLCLQVFRPLVKVLQIVDVDGKPSMGFVYGELAKAKEEIKVVLNNLPKTYEPIIEVIDATMKDRLDSPLHLMAYVLNPFYYYKNPLLHLDPNVSLGVIDCLDVLFHGDLDMQHKILINEYPMYRNKESTFGKALAVKACSLNDVKFDPVTWWSNFGAITPHLQRLAIRILSLTTSSSDHERNRSASEAVLRRKRDRLDTNLFNDLMFVQFNARLLSKQKMEKDRSNGEVLFAHEHDSTYAQEWIVDGIDGEDEVGDALCEDGSQSSIIRELYEDDFESEDEEINENNMEYESDEDLVLKDHVKWEQS